MTRAVSSPPADDAAPWGVRRRRFVEARSGAVERAWAPRSVRVDDGPSVGRRQVELRHLGGLEVTVEVDQFLDLGEASWNGEVVSFVASTTAPHAEGWARRWQGGLLTTCGLTAVGVAPPEDGGMHGRAHLIPATVTRSEGRWSAEGCYELAVDGFLREGAVFSQNLTVERGIRAEVGVGRIRLHDIVRNEGFVAEPVRLLYHVNLGWPMLHGGAVVTAEATAAVTAGVDAGSPSAVSSWERTLDEPVAGAAEQVDALDAVIGADGWSTATLSGESGTVAIRFRAEQLPFLTVWRSSAAGSYALGIEPGTCWPSHAEGPERGKLGRILEPGESFDIDLEIAFSPADGPFAD
ncbi:MAG TPA: DUF4432 family protein [Plantibacter sp.]|uniref:DUF4432 family protein n=1 Tax=unclassified Plantibacter TaxID=2624265 RepID=UPI002CEAE4C7|nr:DUF4432 family protein [Plantibacter sp.]